MNDRDLVRIIDLKKYFPVRRGLFSSKGESIKAVDGVSLSIKKREVVGLVGESGCGKTTLGRTILQLEKPSGGEIYFNGNSLLSMCKKEMRFMRRFSRSPASLPLGWLRRWQREPATRPSRGRMWRQHILLPLIPNLLAALTLVPVLGKTRSWIRLFMPDFSYLAPIWGGFALVWSFLRTGLVLKTLRKPRL